MRATDANGLTVEAALTVAGVAAPAEGEGEQRAEEESLLAPMPTRPAVVATSQGRPAARLARLVVAGRAGRGCAGRALPRRRDPPQRNHTLVLESRRRLA